MADQEHHNHVLHDLRGHLSTIQLSALVLESEPDLTETGRMSVKRIGNALLHAEQMVEQLEQVTRVTAAGARSEP
jgi:hypothetical protein